MMSIKRLIKIARAKGIDGLVITDHDVFSYPRIKPKIPQESGVFIIPGMEIKTEHGDLIGVMLNEEISSRDFDECVDEIHEQGGYAILPHPFRRRSSREISELAKQVDIVEVYNARTSVSANNKAKRVALSLNKPMTAGSDAHLYMEIGRGLTGVEKSDGVEDIMKNVLKKRVKLRYIPSPRYVHYFSSLIGAYKTGDYRTFVRGAYRHIRGHHK